MRVIRIITGLALLPCCAAATRTFFFIVFMLGISLRQPPAPPVLAIIAGVLSWLAILALLPKPTRAYVLAHELSHALWGVAFAARVSGMRVSKQGGHVKLSKHNAAVVLAPYFFPFYTFLVILLYWILGFFFYTQRYYLVLLGLIGFTLGFHFSFTLQTLSGRQSDIQKYGRFFSYPLIYLLCILQVTILMAVVSPDASFDIFARRLASDMAIVWTWCWSNLLALFTRFLQ